MKRKIIIAVLISLVLGGAQAFSWGIGAEAGIDAFGGLPGESVMLTVQFPKLPILWGIGAHLNGNESNVGLTADWWLINQNLTGILNIYVGPGLYLAAPKPFEIGGRLPVGLNIFPLNFLELFIEAAPALVLYSSASGISIPNFRLQGALGLRFWFK
ncbi:MAG TPA: hypothetical protein VMW87_02520 [Spirochaetia bacterium]|nr:hypothetical protein [Spirochaetia bacterium]